MSKIIEFFKNLFKKPQKGEGDKFLIEILENGEQAFTFLTDEKKVFNIISFFNQYHDYFIVYDLNNKRIDIKFKVKIEKK